MYSTWPQIHHVAEDGLKLPILLPLPRGLKFTKLPRMASNSPDSPAFTTETLGVRARTTTHACQVGTSYN